MTRLYELYQKDRDSAIEKIRNMDNAQLCAELDDTLQFDVLHKSNVEWVKMPGTQLYRTILAELSSRR